MRTIAMLIFCLGSLWLNSQCLMTDVAKDYPQKEILATKASLPLSFSWRETMGPVGDQGNQGSCVAWSISYTVTQQKAQKINWDFSSHSEAENLAHWVSPASIYNPVRLLYKPWSSGIGYSDGLNQVVTQGIAFMADFPYNQYDDSTQLSMDLRIASLTFRCLEWFWSYDLQVAKEQLQFGPINSFIHNESGSNHALCIVGYNDTLQVDGKIGAFLVMNSIGSGWRDNGFGWYPYNRFSQFYFLKDIPEDIVPEQIIRLKFNLAEKPMNHKEASFFLINGFDSTKLELSPAVNDFLLPINESDINTIYIKSDYTIERDKPTQPIEMRIDSCEIYESNSRGFSQLEYIWNRFDTILDTIVHSPVHINYLLYSQLTATITLPETWGLPSWDKPTISLSAYPNPFCGQINFRIDLPTKGVVDLVIYDLNGKELAILANKKVMSQGEHLFSWAADLPPGIYMVKLTLNNQTVTQKIVAVR